MTRREECEKWIAGREPLDPVAQELRALWRIKDAVAHLHHLIDCQEPMGDRIEAERVARDALDAYDVEQGGNDE